MTSIPDDVVARMTGLVRDLASICTGELYPFWRRFVREASEINALLPEPVDPDLIEAREIAGDILNRLGASVEQIAAGDIKAGERDDALIVHATLAALKRGRELAQAQS